MDQQTFRTTVGSLAELFGSCTDPDAKAPEGGWTVRQVLGHLVDSAANNMQRLQRYVSRGELRFPGYDQEAFVWRAGYGTFDYQELLGFWRTYNRLLWHTWRHVPAPDADSRVVIGEKPAVPLRQLLDDYVKHLLAHEAQVKAILEAQLH